MQGFNFLVLSSILVNVKLTGVQAYNSGHQAYDIVTGQVAPDDSKD